MMAAYVEESTQDVIVPANHYNRFARDSRGHELARLLDLPCSPNHLPRVAEHCLAFEFGDTWIDIPPGGNGRSFRERSGVVILRENLLDGFHPSVLYRRLPMALCRMSRN